ncbi:MAG TPA: histidine kinase [Steroidobacteraceae bacterium]|nr:histidine kinase [Steroidobacteraceae bacterium]
MPEPTSSLSDGWRHTPWREIFRIIAPFWLYVALANVLTGLLLNGGMDWPYVASRVLQHLLLLPLLLLCYRLALIIGWPATGRLRAALLQLALGIAFALSTRFVVWVTFSLVMWDPAWMTSATMELVPELRMIGIAFLIFFLPYWAGLALLLGVLSYRRLRDVTLRAAHVESEYVKARLQVLHGQINPHFLFNTLHSVHGLIDEQPAVARTMLVRLSDLLRRSLQQGPREESGQGQIELAEEVELTRTYLEIQQMRFSDRLQFDIQVDNALARARVPVFILQPLAENAIKHGIGGESERVVVRIRARTHGGLLELEVANTASRPAQGVREFGVGLTNTTERLRTLYGERASLSFERPADNGFIVRVRLPFEAESAQAA